MTNNHGHPIPSIPTNQSMKRLLVADAHTVFCELIASRIATAQKTFREIRWITQHGALKKQLAEGTPDIILLGTNFSPNERQP